jgi:hypothetical protein
MPNRLRYKLPELSVQLVWGMSTESVQLWTESERLGP